MSMPDPDYHDYYSWQTDVPNFGRAAQETLRHTTALVSRIGGLGGPLAFSLAAAGVGQSSSPTPAHSARTTSTAKSS